MSGLSRETLELIASWAEILTAAFGILAATAAVVYLLANKPLRRLESHDNEVLKGTVAEAKTALLVQQEKADLAAGKLAELEQDAANAKAEMARQQTRAATAEKALLELQQRLAHRRIDKLTQDKLIADLRPFAGATVLVLKLGEAESAAYADDVIAVLQGAGWLVRISFAGSMSPPPYGLICKVDESTPAGRALAASFQKLPTAQVISTAIGPSLVANIIVGHKPPA